MLKTITNREFRRSFGETLDQVKNTRKSICITQHGVPWVMLKPPGDVDEEGAAEEKALSVRLNLSDYLNIVHYQRNSLVITRRRHAVACLCPLELSA
jgi:prevent-host-death family protein